MFAVDFGKKHNSCEDAMEWRKSLGPKVTQTDAWRLCKRGDWMIWQLRKGLSEEQFRSVLPALKIVLEKIVTRAIYRGLKSLKGVNTPWATEWRRWAVAWLSDEDRTAGAAECESESWAAAAGARAAAGAAAARRPAA